jgi:hypothetical protein
MRDALRMARWMSAVLNSKTLARPEDSVARYIAATFPDKGVYMNRGVELSLARALQKPHWSKQNFAASFYSHARIIFLFNGSSKLTWYDEKAAWTLFMAFMERAPMHEAIKNCVDGMLAYSAKVPAEHFGRLAEVVGITEADHVCAEYLRLETSFLDSLDVTALDVEWRKAAGAIPVCKC